MYTIDTGLSMLQQLIIQGFLGGPQAKRVVSQFLQMGHADLLLGEACAFWLAGAQVVHPLVTAPFLWDWNAHMELEFRLFRSGALEAEPAGSLEVPIPSGDLSVSDRLIVCEGFDTPYVI